MTIDDEIQVLNAIERDLQAKFQKDYRVLKANSGTEALHLTQKLKQRNTPVALFLADQRMPDMIGTEFLVEARKLFPQARTVMLTAYADTEAAIESINKIGLDYYLQKPWDPPEEHLYPVLEDLLSDWQASASLPYEGIRVAGTLWSATSHNSKDFLARNRVPFQFLDIESNAEARTLVDSIESGKAKLPVVFFPDGKYLINPNNRQLAEKLGIQTKAGDKHYDLIIIGGGPAGLGAAVYGASEGLRTLLIERKATGGQAGTSSRIENYLGFPQGISGTDLARRATDQALRLGSEILTAREAVKVAVEDKYKIITLDDGSEISCLALVIATGVTLRELDVPGVHKFHGAGVYYGAALTEAANYSGQHVYVIGAANSAGQGAIGLSRFADKVTILVRGGSLSVSMSQYLINQIENKENIEVLYNKSVEKVEGSEVLQKIFLKDSKSNQIEELDAAAMFIFIGAVPHTGLLEGVVQRTEAGFIPTGPELIMDGKLPKDWTAKRDPFLLESSSPGIFAAGDIRESAVRRVASAVGQGAIAISEIHQYLKTI
jgi:thioredoxin reductase (NADPH)